jgi:hypothetical protein
VSSVRIQTLAMTAEELTIPLSALVTHLDVTVIVCHRMGARRREGAGTGAWVHLCLPSSRVYPTICRRVTGGGRHHRPSRG